MEDPTSRRLTELEIKTSFQEDWLEQLNQLVYEQQLKIDQLTEELGRLRLQLQDNAATPAFRSLRDELPPHY
ncbi:SlyX family protein [Hydrogenophaga aquatica]